MSETYYARRTMTYGRPGSEKALDRGQILSLEGCINDEKLVRLGYVAQASKGIAVVSCGTCGAKFTTDEALASHGRERHASMRPLTPKEQDERDEKRLKKEDEISPLDLTKTAASRGVRTHTR